MLPGILSVGALARGLSPGTVHNGTTQTSTTANFATGYTQFDRDLTVNNGLTIYSIGSYSNTSGSMKAKVALQNSTTSFTIVLDQAFSHPGTGWFDVVLTTPYTVPGSGTYRVGFFLSGTQFFSGSGNRSVIMTDHTSGTNAGYSADASGNWSTRWTEGI